MKPDRVKSEQTISKKGNGRWEKEEESKGTKEKKTGKKTLKPVQSEQKIIPQQRQWCLRRKKPKGL